MSRPSTRRWRSWRRWRRRLLAVYGNDNWPTSVMGTDNGFLAVRDWPLSAGRAFELAELRAGRLVCVIGATVRE